MTCALRNQFQIQGIGNYVKKHLAFVDTSAQYTGKYLGYLISINFAVYFCIKEVDLGFFRPMREEGLAFIFAIFFFKKSPRTENALDQRGDK